MGQFSFGDGGLKVSRYVLSNGLRVLLLADPSAPVLSYHTWFRVGSKHEQPGKTGLAHLFEHLMFNETKHVPRGQLDRLIESAGGETNAATWVDWTHYHSELPSSELPLIVRLEADRMQHLVLRKPQVASEKEVVANERRFRVEDDIEGQVSELLYATAFTRHPYHWPTIGWRSDVEAIRTEQIRAYYERHYMPNNATAVIVGDVEAGQALGLVERHFGSIASGTPPDAVVTVEPPQQGERRFQLRKPGDTRYLMIGWPIPALVHPDNYALDVMGMILGHGKTSRLYQRLVEGKLATEAEAQNETARDPFLFIAQATAAPGVGLDALEEAVFEEAERLTREVPVQAEMDRARKQLQASFVYSRDSIRSLAQQLGYYETVGSYRYLDTYLDRIAAVTREDVSRVARDYLGEDARTVGRYEPTHE